MSSEILVSLSASCLLQPLPRQQSPIALLDVPRFVAQELEVRGINIPVQMIRQQSPQTLERLRDEADRAQCPCLVLYRDEPLDFVTEAEKSGQVLREMGKRARLLGCAEIAVRVAKVATATAQIAPLMKTALDGLQKFEVNLLIRPCEEPCDQAEAVIELVRKIGGFHIGAMPSFASVAATGDAVQSLRKLIPYSLAVEASVTGVDKQGLPNDDCFDDHIDMLVKLGFSNKLSIDWRGGGNWAQGVQHVRSHLMRKLGQGDPVA
ncbi:MAG: hypothetical protein EBR10_06480 [Planctomycetes bacterium]|nr:hypothetical protein [Planctomycetota bacterium]